MIRVVTEDSERGVLLSVTGHANPREDGEHKLVCAATSALLMTLQFYCMTLEELDKDWDGLGDARCDVPLEHLALVEFVVSGLHLISMAYVGHYEFALNGTRLKGTTERWKQLLQ